MYPVTRAKHRNDHIQQKLYKVNQDYQVEYLQFPKLSQMKQVKHLFSTRFGGVSEGYLGSMNFSFSRGDEPERVLENFRRIGEILGCEPDCFVATQQTHTTNIRVVTEEDAGKGVVREQDYSDVDGLITNVKGLVLAGFYADCVPLYFVDPVKSVIGVAHSGWRGTAAGMGACMVRAMQQEYGCNPEDIFAAIGPSICQQCYEISEEVMLEFTQGFWASEDVKKLLQEGDKERGMILPGRESGKYQLDLWKANEIILRSVGIKPEKLEVTDICTCCNPEYLFSHRASKGLRGNLAAFITLG